VSNVNLEIGGRSSGQSEARMLLFAALLMADECHELKQGGGDIDSSDHGELLESIAGRLEKCAALLEG
jgi:cell division protein ZapA